ncbi:hypothetical protein UCD39_03580 [Nitrospirillum sp. BR 11752]|uniref:hypothetical protein n=1 Tax=Nitrospirillum sp. BR 11752 TaxID=3104293 RepID=UPI002EBCD2A0|nr:hypothetical protein [Nitrospirillum sp. BR 11752]
MRRFTPRGLLAACAALCVAVMPLAARADEVVPHAGWAVLVQGYHNGAIHGFPV